MARLPVGLAVVFATTLSVAAFAQDRTYRIGTVSGQLDVTPESFRPFTDYLASRIPGTRFEMVPLPTIEAFVEAVEADQLHFALATPVAFVALSTHYQVRPIGTVTQRAANGTYPWLAGAVFVRASSTDITRLDDARGRTILALSPLALGGWLSAVREWRAIGLDPEKDASTRFLFSYQQVAEQVCAGRADIGVLAAATLRDVAGVCPAGFRVLLPPPGSDDPRYPIEKSTRVYPEAAFAVVGDVDEQVITRVTQELLGIEAGGEVARAALVAGFTAPLSYAPVRDLMEELRVPPFENAGQLTFREALRQHAGKVTSALLFFLVALAFAFARARRDIAERKHAEAERAHLEGQLQHSQRMDSIGRLAGAVAHDFNNLLTVINGYTEVMAERAAAEGRPRRELDQIAKAGQRAAELTQQLLTFSRKQVFQPRPVDVNAILGESTALLARLIGEDIRVVVHEDVSVGRILADPGQLHQVIMNLGVNARDAMPSGGTLTITTTTVHFTREMPMSSGVLQPGAYTALIVSDTGVGMDADIQQRVFEPFFSTKGEAGTGLGLSTVYGIIRQLQGAIAISSEVGHGTTVTIYMPVTDLTDRPHRAAGTPRVHTPATGQTILLVEDQAEVRGFARNVLQAAGYQVLEAASGDAALLVARDHTGQIDLLLTDVVLRGMNGRELAEEFSTRYPAARVLFTSGYTDDVIARRGVIQGLMQLLPKPYSVEALLASVRAVLADATSVAE